MLLAPPQISDFRKLPALRYAALWECALMTGVLLKTDWQWLGSCRIRHVLQGCLPLLFVYRQKLSKKRLKRAFFELKIISKHKHVKTTAELPFPFLFVNTSFSKRIAKEDSRQNAAWNQRNQGKNFIQIYSTTLGTFAKHLRDEIWLNSPRFMNF